MTAAGWHLVRVTLEAASPLSCGSGEAGADADILLVRDPSGLPMIPGSTIQGLLRALHPPAGREALFGREDSNGNGQAGRLLFSHARVHDSKDVAVGFPANLSDPLLKELAAEVPLKRDHVKLHHRHAAAKGAKFDRAAVPIGARFSFEVLMRGEESEKETLLDALAYLAHPFFRVGGKGRRGYGRVMVHAAHHGFFVPAEAGKFRTIRSQPLSNWQGLKPAALTMSAPVTVITLSLTPEGPWRTGGSGAPTVFSQSISPTDQVLRKAADTAPLREAAIAAENGRRALQRPGDQAADDYVLPGSSVAGPLRHRTVFHWNRLNKQFVDLAADPAKVEALAEQVKPVDRLFGWSRPKPRAARPDGRVSALRFDDLRFKPNTLLALDHVVIDAFHGGARARLLFDEELVAADQIEVKIAIEERFMETEATEETEAREDATAREALAFAIRDLLKGRLAIGAKSYGFMTGTHAVDGPERALWNDAITAALTPAGAAAG